MKIQEGQQQVCDPSDVGEAGTETTGSLELISQGLDSISDHVSKNEVKMIEENIHQQQFLPPHTQVHKKYMHTCMHTCTHTYKNQIHNFKREMGMLRWITY